MTSKYDLKCPPAYQLDSKKFTDFVKSLDHLNNYAPKIQVLKEPNIQIEVCERGKDLFADIIREIVPILDDPEVGIVALDLPNYSGASPETDAFWGVMAVSAISQNIFTPTRESLNGTPFTIYTASAENEKKLKEAGLSYYSPSQKLGFHNDGLIKKGKDIYIPNHILIYNLSISYRRPGNFYWVPFALWRDMEEYVNKIGKDRRFKVRLTPIVYPGQKSTLDVRGLQEIEVPLFTKDNNGRDTMFLNGDIIGAADKDNFDLRLIKELRSSISNNPIRYAVGQAKRRVIFLKNSLGCHARDIFEDPIPGVKYTRSFLRSVDTDGVALQAA